MIVTGAVAIILQQSDRYFLKCFADMDQVGVYSMAHKISHSFTTVIMLPFTMIWNVVAYEHANSSRADEIYSEVFRFFTTGMVVFLAGVAIVVSPLIHIIGKSEYSYVANLVPILCIGCFFNCIATFFTLPARLEKKTLHLLPASIIGAVFCIAANVAVVPRFGALGAAWVSVGTFAIFAMANHVICRKVRPIPFPLVAPFGLGSACVAASILYRPMANMISSFWLFNAIWLLMWLAVAIIVLKSPLTWTLQQLSRRRRSLQS